MLWGQCCILTDAEVAAAAKARFVASIPADKLAGDRAPLASLTPRRRRPSRTADASPRLRWFGLWRSVWKTHPSQLYNVTQPADVECAATRMPSALNHGRDEGGIDDEVMLDAAIEISMHEAAMATAGRCQSQNRHRA